MSGRPAVAITSAMIGGLAAGALLSIVFLAMEPVTGEPSDLVKLQRRSLSKAGVSAPAEEAVPGAGEQVAAHGGHLVLSTLAGGLYGAVKPDGARPLAAGAVFGAVFYALAFGMIGPAFRLTAGLSRNRARSAVQHVLCHLLFGVTTALVADRVAETANKEGS